MDEDGRERLRDLAFVLVLVIVLGWIAVYRLVLEHRCREAGGTVADARVPGRPAQFCRLPDGSTIELTDL